MIILPTNLPTGIEIVENATLSLFTLPIYLKKLQVELMYLFQHLRNLF